MAIAKTAHPEQRTTRQAREEAGRAAGKPAGEATRPSRTRRVAAHPPWVGWAFIAPNLLGVLLFTLIPVVSALLIAFTDWNVVSGIGGIRFIGLGNFTELLGDDLFWHSLRLTAVYTGIAVPASVAIGLALALALNRPLPARSALRAIFFLPYIVHQVAVGMTWMLLFNPSSGLVNEGLRALGIDKAPLWLASSDWSLPALILICIWGHVGYIAVIYLAALQSMPTDLYEAAALDGAGPWRKFTTVTWPALLPTTTFLVITVVIQVAQSFGLVALLTQGGPNDSTRVLSYFMYQKAFEFYRFGYASAVGMVTFVGVLLLTLGLWRFQKTRSLYDE